MKRYPQFLRNIKAKDSGAEWVEMGWTNDYPVGTGLIRGLNQKADYPGGPDLISSVSRKAD